MLLEDLAVIGDLLTGYRVPGSRCDECDLTISEDEPQSVAAVTVNEGIPSAGAILFVICDECGDAGPLTVVRKRAEGSLHFNDGRKQFLRFISPKAVPYIPQILAAKKAMVSQ